MKICNPSCHFTLESSCDYI